MLSATIQPEFSPLVAAIADGCSTRFAGRLAAGFLAGSIAAGEGWPGVSDVDWFTFVDSEPTDGDRAWQKRVESRLRRAFPVVSGVHLNVNPVSRLQSDSAWRFILRYNSRRVLGRNVLAELDRSGCRTPRPGRTYAQRRVGFVSKCLAEAAAGQFPAALGTLPDTPGMASRKLARTFVIVEGAYALMCLRRFKSFAAEAVLSGLAESAPKWKALVRTTRSVLADPLKSAVAPVRYMTEIEPFVRWALGLTQAHPKTR